MVALLFFSFGFMACDGTEAPIFCAVTIPGQGVNHRMTDKPIKPLPPTSQTTNLMPE